MDPNKIELENFKYASEIDNIDDIEDVKNIAKSYFKLYLKQQEVISNLGIHNL